MKNNEYENNQNQENNLPIEFVESERLEYSFSTCVEMLRQKTGKSIIPDYILENSLSIKTSEIHYMMKENDFPNLNSMFLDIMKKFIALMMDKTSKFQFNIKELNEILIKMNKYPEILKTTIDALKYSDMNCEIMIDELRKIPSMEGIKIPKSHMPNIIYVDILDPDPKRPIGNSSLIIKRLKNVEVDGKMYKDGVYCYTFFQSSSFLSYCHEETLFYSNILRSLSNKFDYIDLPFRYNNPTKYRIIDETGNEHFCDDCFANEICQGSSLLRQKERYMYNEKGEPSKYVFFTDSTKKHCGEFFNREYRSRPSMDNIYNLARYILYMYTTRNYEKVLKPTYKIDCPGKKG